MTTCLSAVCQKGTFLQITTSLTGEPPVLPVMTHQCQNGALTDTQPLVPQGLCELLSRWCTLGSPKGAYLLWSNTDPRKSGQIELWWSWMSQASITIKLFCQAVHRSVLGESRCVVQTECDPGSACQAFLLRGAHRKFLFISRSKCWNIQWIHLC